VTLFCDLFAQHAPAADPTLTAITAPLHAAASRSALAAGAASAAGSWKAATAAADRRAPEPIIQPAATSQTGAAAEGRVRRRRTKAATGAGSAPGGSGDGATPESAAG
jgi:hypothetical protein